MNGRPLRFLGGVLASWAAIRVVLLWPGALPAPIAPAAAAYGTGPMPVVADVGRRRNIIQLSRVRHSSVAMIVAEPARLLAQQPVISAADLGTRRDTTAPMVTLSDRPRIPPPITPTPFTPTANRFSGSIWAIAREGQGGTPGAQLGGTQAGVRVRYALGDARRLALTARLAAPARGTGREAALGVEWRPSDLPVRIIAEQRIALDRGRGGPSLLVVAGLPTTRVAGLALEAYGQGGAIARDGIEGFADGAARLTRTMGALDIGVGTWGGVQRGAERVDIGPTLGLRLPMRPGVRVTLDWRVRVAGRARPDSGLALSIGSDF